MARLRRQSKANDVKPDPERVKELAAKVKRVNGKHVKGSTSRHLMRATNESHQAYLRRLAREHTEDAIHALSSIMVDGRRNDSARVKAASELLNRGYGKPTQVVEQVVGSRALYEIPTHELVELLKENSKKKDKAVASESEENRLHAELPTAPSKDLPEPEILAADGYDATP